GMTGLGRFVARPGFSIHGIEARQLRATLDLFDNPRLHALVLRSLLRDARDEIRRNHHGAVVVADDHIAREDRAAAATDWLLPTDKGEPVHRSGRRDPCAPH